MSPSGAPTGQPAGSPLTVQTLRVRSALLCSDIHLTDASPQITQRFLTWLDHELRKPPETLLILGDLFDAWIGDDLLDSPQSPACARQLISALSAASARGIAVGIMHGNRDFLIGKQFAHACGAFLMADPFVLEFMPAENTPTPKPSGQRNAQRIVLSHGDALCTDDLDYQQFRLQVRDSSWQQAFLRQPLNDRLQTAQGLRTESEKEKSGKSMAITDINPAEAVRFSEALQADLLIHGHTHRPGRYQLPNGTPRWVLSDWAADRGDGIRL